MEPISRIMLAKEAPLRVGRVVVDPAARTVIGVDGQSERLEPRVMQVLVQLARADGGVVSRDDLTECCWEGRIVGDDSINRVISRLRKVAAERGGGFSIETIARVGYRLIGEIAPVAHPEPAGSEQPPALTLIRGFDTRRRRFWAMLAGVGALATVAMTGLAAEAARARARQRGRGGRTPNNWSSSCSAICASAWTRSGGSTCSIRSARRRCAITASNRSAH